MMGQDEGWNMVRWIVSPPAFPARVRPFPANGPEHIPSENPGPDVPEAASGEIIIDAGRAVILAEQDPLECACRDQPLVQFRPADAEWIVDVLMRPGSVSIERDGEAFNANSCHRLPPFHGSDVDMRLILG